MVACGCDSGIVVGAFRAGRTSKDKSKSYPWLQGILPIECATGVHVKLLVPQGQKDDNGWHLCSCNALTPVVPLDPHNGSLVFEICKDHFKCSFDKHEVTVWVSTPAVKAISKTVKSNVPFAAKKKEQVDEGKTWYGEEDFTRSNTGTKNIIKFMEKMKKDYRNHCGSLEDKDGNIKLHTSVTVCWDELMARVGSYFRRYTKGHSYFKGLSKEWQQKPCFGFKWVFEK